MSLDLAQLACLNAHPSKPEDLPLPLKPVSSETFPFSCVIAEELTCFHHYYG